MGTAKLTARLGLPAVDATVDALERRYGEALRPVIREELERALTRPRETLAELAYRHSPHLDHDGEPIVYRAKDAARSLGVSLKTFNELASREGLSRVRLSPTGSIYGYLATDLADMAKRLQLGTPEQREAARQQRMRRRKS